MNSQQVKILITAKDLASKVLKGVKRNLKGLTKAAGKMGRVLKSSLKSVVTSLLSFKSAIIGAAGVAGMGLLIKSSLTAIDKLGKVSSKLGVTSQELQKFRYAARQAGIEETALDMGLQRFIRRAGEAAKGTGEAKDALNEMGIKLKDSSGKLRSASDLLGQVAQAMQKTKDPADRLRLAFKLFDSEGVAMVNMLKNGKGALNATMLEAEKLGFILSSTTVAGVERANEAFFKMGKAIGGVWNKLVGALAPSLEKMGNWFATFAATFSTTIAPLFDWLEHTLGRLGIGFGDAAKAGDKWGKLIGYHAVELTKKIINFFTTMTDGKTDADRFWKAIKTGASDTLAVISAIASAIRAVSNAWKSMRSTASKAGALLSDVNAKTGTNHALNEMRAPRLPGEDERKSGQGRNKRRSDSGGNVTNIFTAATAHGINNALDSRGDGGSRSGRNAINVSKSRSAGGHGNLSGGRR